MSEGIKFDAEFTIEVEEAGVDTWTRGWPAAALRADLRLSRCRNDPHNPLVPRAEGFSLFFDRGSCSWRVCIVSDEANQRRSRRVSHRVAACQGIFRPGGDARHRCSALFTVRSGNSIQAAGTRQGLISGDCTVAPTVSLRPLRRCSRSRCLVKSG